MSGTENEPFKETVLTGAQREGMHSLGLSEAQVRTVNFGTHTVEGIQDLVASNATASNKAAFNLLKGLDAIQTNGVLAGLSRENVTAENFGEHTLLGIDHLKFQDESLSTLQAFNLVNNLNADQVNGILTFQLTSEQVRTENFGAHTLDGIRRLRTDNEDLSAREAFAQIAGLNKVQTEGYTQLSLSREQVENPRFRENILNTIVALKEFNPLAVTQTAYDYALQMPEYQSRAIGKFGFSPEEMGIVTVGEDFIQEQTPDKTIASGSTVDAAAFLMEEYMNPQTARETAYKLNTTQVIGIVDMGLRLEQVQSPFFNTAEKVVDGIFDELQKETNEFPELPLTEENRNASREILARMILESTTREALKDYNLADDISIMSDSSLLRENEEPLDHLKPLEGNDINEFLKYASSLSELAIFDSIQERIQQSESQVQSNESSLSRQKASPVRRSMFFNEKEINLGAFKTPVSPQSPGRKEEKDENAKKPKTPLSPRKDASNLAEKKPKRRKL